jgi:hypothetical protein
LKTKPTFARFTDEEYVRRYRVVRQAMQEQDVHAIPISVHGALPRSTLSNYLAQSPSWVLVPRDGEASCFIQFFNHEPCAKAYRLFPMCAGTGLRLCRRSLKRSRRKALDKCRIGLVTLRGIRYGHVTELKRLLPEADLVEFDPSFTKFGKSVARKN